MAGKETLVLLKRSKSLSMKTGALVESLGSKQDTSRRERDETVTNGALLVSSNRNERAFVSNPFVFLCSAV